jgi:hypothetical protein
LIGEGNPDVATCIDCHGVHNIEDPTTTAFRVESPSICANCHTDPQIMNKYGISTDVMDTYVADFHGTTQVLFNDQSEDAQFNKPVCYDCHGVHDIARPDDPQKGLLVRQNLLARCQECHPDASENFPDAWLSHYIPSREQNTLVFYVDLFYRILIPVVIGGMALLVSLDLSRRGLNSYRARRPEPVSAPASPEVLATEAGTGEDPSTNETPALEEAEAADSPPGEPSSASETENDD